MEFLTDFADQAVALPVAVAVLIVLLASGARRSAAAWVVAVGGTWGLVLLLKLGIAACPAPWRDGGLLSPSGHVAAGVVVYAGLLMLLGARVGVVALAAGLIAGSLASSRVLLGAHTIVDVMTGALAGAAGLLALGVLRPAAPERSLPQSGAARAALALSITGLVLLLHGQRLQAEPLIRQVAETYMRSFLGCGTG